MKLLDLLKKMSSGKFDVVQNSDYLIMDCEIMNASFYTLSQFLGLKVQKYIIQDDKMVIFVD